MKIYDKPDDFKIEKLWCFCSIGPRNNEGIMGILGPDGWLPMITGDKKRFDEVLPLAQDIAKQTGISVEIKEFYAYKTYGKIDSHGKYSRENSYEQ